MSSVMTQEESIKSRSSIKRILSEIYVKMSHDKSLPVGIKKEKFAC